MLGNFAPPSMSLQRNYTEETYKVWACDNQVYGPIELPMLVQWVQEGRVLPETWVFMEANNEWRQARKIEPLHVQFPPGNETTFLQQLAEAGGELTPQELRQVPILSNLSNAALAQVIRLGYLHSLEPGKIVLRKGEPGDALFFVLSGTLRARLIVGLEDKTLAKIGAGEVFGEMAMFTQSPRSADVVCEEEARLLRLDAQGFHQLIERNSEAAAPMLFSMASMMANRIKDQNWRFQRDSAAEFLWR